MSAIADTVYALFGRFGYAAIFFGVMLDSVGIPIPGELVLLLTGSLVAEGRFALAAAVAVAAAGALAADSAWYFIGRLGSRRLIGLYCRFSFGSTACLASTERNLARFGPRSLMYARFIPGFRTFAAPMAGMSGVPYRRFLLYDGIGALLWASVGAASGALFADRISDLVRGFQSVQETFVYVAAAGLSLFVLMKWLVRRRHGRARIQVSAEGAAPLPSRELA